jgi:hypothetical protein
MIPPRIILAKGGAAMSHANSKSTQFIDGMANLFAHSLRTPILRRPDEYGMAYEDIYFPSMDGVVLEGWFIPADSDKLVIANHPMPCNRYGFPGHLEPFGMFGGFECDFVKDYKRLHDAGYDVIADDLRNHGRSADSMTRPEDVEIYDNLGSKARSSSGSRARRGDSTDTTISGNTLRRCLAGSIPGSSNRCTAKARRRRT